MKENWFGLARVWAFLGFMVKAALSVLRTCWWSHTLPCHVNFLMGLALFAVRERGLTSMLFTFSVQVTGMTRSKLATQVHKRTISGIGCNLN